MVKIYTTKEVPLEDETKLISFLDNHWKRHHSIVASKTLLQYQHLNKEKDGYHFIAGENNETKEYDALVGYIPTAQYDETLEEQGDYWGAIWKIREDVSNTEINNEGFYIWRRLFKLPHFNSYAAIGISEIAKQIYIASRMPTGVLAQYYVANKNVSDFKIASNLQKKSLEGSANSWTINNIVCLNDIEAPEYSYRPYKTKKFFVNRYELHPFYKYNFWGINGADSSLHAVFVVRRMVVNNTSAFRIVDVLGKIEELPCLYKQLQTKLQEESAEYVDFMNYGIAEEHFNRIGFITHNPESTDIILPNYFEPFLQQNVKVDIAYKADFDYVVFKADSDQDRPNVL